MKVIRDNGMRAHNMQSQARTGPDSGGRTAVNYLEPEADVSQESGSGASQGIWLCT